LLNEFFISLKPKFIDLGLTTIPTDGKRVFWLIISKVDLQRRLNLFLIEAEPIVRGTIKPIHKASNLLNINKISFVENEVEDAAI